MNLLDTYLEYTEPFKGSKKYHTWSFVSVLAAILERRVWLPMGGLGKLYPNHYIVLCGGPGTGKTTSSNLAVSFIKRYNRSLGPNNGGVKFGPDKMTPAAFLRRFGKCTKTIKGIPTIGSIEQSAMFVHSTELSTMIKDIGGGSLTDDLLKLYDCDDYFEKETIKDGTMHIPYPCLNLLADTTPSFLSGFLPREESGTGFTARIMFVTERGFVDMDSEIPEGNPVLEQMLLTGIARSHSLKGPFKLDSKALDYWKAWFPLHREKMFQIHDGNFMRYFYARKPVHIRKLAMVLSVAEGTTLMIKESHFARAIEMVEALEPNLAMSFGVQDYRRTSDFGKQILDLIPLDQEISKGTLINALFRSGLAGSINDLDANLATLVAGGFLAERFTGNEQFFKRLV